MPRSQVLMRDARDQGLPGGIRQMTTDIYHGWRIYHDPPPIPIRNCDWQAWREFDWGSVSMAAPTREALIALIDEEEGILTIPRFLRRQDD